MAYGKIKADTLVYDNSGSDTEVTISSLGNKANLPASAGTVGASEVVQVDANKDITGFRNVTLSGDLTVNGTTTTIDSTTLTVEDKNIELGKVDTPTDTTADGGGITLKGATDKEIKWVDATNHWTFNQNIEIKKGEAFNAELHFTADEGDDNADKWKIVAFDGSSSGTFNLYNYASGSWEKSIEANGNGNVELYYDNSKKIETTANGVTVTGSVTDSKGDVRKIVQNYQTGAYTLVVGDAGKCITITTGGVTVNQSIFLAGDAVTIINHSGSDQTITQGSSFTLYNTADASTGNRTLAGRGMATLFFTDHNIAYISGAGLS